MIMKEYLHSLHRTRSAMGIFLTLLSVTAFCLTAPLAHADTVKILMLGNSITQAESNHASYRYPLWKKLVDADIDFDLVGSMNLNFDKFNPGPPPQPDYKGLKFDPDHEGHFAWRVDEFINGRNYDNGSGDGKLADWLKTYDVDIALIHLGTNDAFQRLPHEVTIQNLKAIINLLREDNPKVVIMLAQLIPAAQSPGDDEAVQALNIVILQIASTIHTDESPVIVVDHFSGIDLGTDTYDKVHPTASGEEKMGQVWFDAINDYLKSTMQN
jgi:lysophospholipase L1-like esterase